MAKHSNILRMLGGQSHGTSQRLLLQLYKGLVLARPLYALPLLHLDQRSWVRLERAQRRALRICLGVPPTASSRHTLNETGVNTVQNAATERALHHLVRIAETPGAMNPKGLWSRLLHQIAGEPVTLRSPPPPDERPLRVEMEAGLRRPKRELPTMAARQLAEGHLGDNYKGWHRVYTDGSVDPLLRMAAAAAVTGGEEERVAERLSFYSSSTTAQLAEVFASRGPRQNCLLEPSVQYTLRASGSREKREKREHKEGKDPSVPAAGCNTRRGVEAPVEFTQTEWQYAGSGLQSAGHGSQAFVVLFSISASNNDIVEVDVNSWKPNKEFFHVALEYGYGTDPERVVFLCDSKAALGHLRNPDRAPGLAKSIVVRAGQLQRQDWDLAYQWLPAHCGILGNETADRMAAEALKGAGSQNPTVLPFEDARLLISRTIALKHPELEIGPLPARVPDGISRQAAAVLHRLRTGSARTPAARAQWQQGKSGNCTSCNVLADAEHLLLHCAVYKEERSALQASYRRLGGDSV
ncbi:uncharacterized protein LOC144159103 [Haemaphysalis longicornis]